MSVSTHNPNDPDQCWPDAHIVRQLAERMGPCKMPDLDAEMAWCRAMVAAQAANADLMGYLGAKVQSHPHYDPATPMREQLGELPGGSWLVARFDHSILLAGLLDTVMAEPVGMLGGD